MLALCSAEFIMFHVFVRFAAAAFVTRTRTRPFGVKEMNHVSMALILSSFGKILLLVMVIWDYGNLDPSFLINVFVLMSNFCAINGK
jgi:lipid intermediate transporter